MLAYLKKELARLETKLGTDALIVQQLKRQIAEAEQGKKPQAVRYSLGMRGSPVEPPQKRLLQ